MNMMAESSQTLLNTENSRREAVMALMRKDAVLTKLVQTTFAKVKQYEERELMLQMNNYKLQTQLKNLCEGNQYLINAIAEKTNNCDKLKQEINDYETRNTRERKEARDKLDAKAAYYRNAMCGAQEEYKTVNLEADQKVYEMKSAGALEEIHQLEKKLVGLKKELEDSCISKRIDEVDNIIEMLF